MSTLRNDENQNASMEEDERQGSVVREASCIFKTQSNEKSLATFRHWARMVQLMLRAVGLKPKKPEAVNPDFLSWTVVYDEVLGISRLNNYDSGSLTFDPEAYKPNKESSLRDELKDILKLPPAERTELQILMVMKSLQHVVPAFSEFPVKIQKSMVKVCRHEEYEAGRVIIRQGHRAENFYLVLTGSAVVTVMDSGENHVHTANLLGKGSSFGDLAFLNMAKRSATVTCRDDVEVICIERDDFINIFLRGEQGKEPPHFAFLRNLDMLKGWPVNVLPQDNPKICAYTYVRRGVIVSRDSATCDWIVVVVSGSCRIIKAMKFPSQKQYGNSKSLNGSRCSTSQRARDVSTPGSTVSSIAGSVSSLRTKSRGRERNGANSKVHKVVQFSISPAPTADVHDSNIEVNSKENRVGDKNTMRRRKGVYESTAESLYLSTPALASEINIDNEKHLAEIEQIFNKKHILPAIQQMENQRRPSSVPFVPESDKPSINLLRPNNTNQPLPSILRPHRLATGVQPPDLSQSNVSLQPPSILRPHRLSTGIQPPELPQVLVVPPKAADSTNIGFRETDKPVTNPSTNENVFIEVANLEQGDVFGLEQVLMGDFGDVTTCSLVSAGAEVVLINRKFFLKHLTEETAKAIRQKIRPLPSEASLQAQLKIQVSWEAYKAQVFSQHCKPTVSTYGARQTQSQGGSRGQSSFGFTHQRQPRAASQLS